MLNDRDDKYEGHEDSEYHFSDEEVSYEVETDSQKAMPVETKGNWLNRLTRSKRMLISLGVFLILVFVVYKLVAPTSTAPSTEIAASSKTPVAKVTEQNPVASAVSPSSASQPVTAASVTPANPAIPATPAVQGSQPAITQQATAEANSAAAPQANAPTTAAAVNEAASGAPIANNALANQVPGQPGAAPTASPPSSAVAAPPVQSASSAETAQAMPPVIPVQSPTAAPVNARPAMNTDERVANLQATNEKLMSELQADYAQKLNDYSTQNKALQDQVQTLNTRVANMETQMTQLIQALTRQNQQNAPPQNFQPPAEPVVDAHVGYTVQAIIPGRAWLKSDNGETVTVAEGDQVKELGRVTKIDPYDGIVEVNTGTKVISLSYGSGG